MKDLDPYELLKKHQNDWDNGFQYTPMQRDMLLSATISAIAGAKVKSYLQASKVIHGNKPELEDRYDGIPEFLCEAPSPGFDIFTSALKYIPVLRERKGKYGNDPNSLLAIAADLALWLHIWESEDWLKRSERAKLVSIVEVGRHDGSLAAIRQILPSYDGTDTQPLPAVLDNDIEERTVFRAFVLDFLHSHVDEL